MQLLKNFFPKCNRPPSTNSSQNSSSEHLGKESKIQDQNWKYNRPPFSEFSFYFQIQHQLQKVQVKTLIFIDFHFFIKYQNKFLK